MRTETLEPRCECDHMCKVHEQKHVGGVGRHWNHEHSGYDVHGSGIGHAPQLSMCDVIDWVQASAPCREHNNNRPRRERAGRPRSCAAGGGEPFSEYMEEQMVLVG